MYVWDGRVIFLKKDEPVGTFQHIAPGSSSNLVSVSDAASFPSAKESRGHSVISVLCPPTISAVCASHPALMEYLFYSLLPMVVKRTHTHNPFFMTADESSHCARVL